MTSRTSRSAPPHEHTPGWEHSLATGAPGIALLHIEQALTGCSWGTAHRWATAMTRRPVPAHPDAAGLFAGAPAVAFVLHSAGRPRYRDARNALDGPISALVDHRLQQAYTRIHRGDLPTLAEFDLIRGLTGLGVYLLHRHRGGGLLQDVLTYLVRLTEPIHTGGTEVPGWWTRTGPDGQRSADWPGGHGNLGMAHGITGPLALLATTMRRGITVPGQAEAITRICDFLDQRRCGTGPRAWWPGIISMAEWRDRELQQTGPQRPSWCYGTPGIARAQQIAGIALADSQRQKLAEEALAGCVTDEHQLSLLGDASLCHGWAGLIQTTWRTTGDADRDGLLAGLVPELLSQMKKHERQHGLTAADGLLEGMAGISLMRHTVAANRPPASRWDACLLLDG